MRTAPTTGIDPALEYAIAMARREILVLAVAAQQGWDDDDALEAATRLRCALDKAEMLTRVGSTGRVSARLSAVRESAERWLPGYRAVDPSPAQREELVARILDPQRRFARIDASTARLNDLDLSGLPLEALSLRGAELHHVRADGARLTALDAALARLTLVSFGGASLQVAGFERSLLDECDFRQADLELSRWTGAIAALCTVVGARMVDARLDSASFIECDFRGADLGAGLLGVSDLANARFLNCDLRDTSWCGRVLRGASFVDCKLHGVHGAADASGVVIERADLSPAGDGSWIASTSDVMSLWTVQLKVTLALSLLS